MTDPAAMASRCAVIAIIVIVFISVARAGCYVVHQQTKTLIERLGRFHKLADAGLHSG